MELFSHWSILIEWESEICITNNSLHTRKALWFLESCVFIIIPKYKPERTIRIFSVSIPSKILSKVTSSQDSRPANGNTPEKVANTGCSVSLNIVITVILWQFVSGIDCRWCGKIWSRQDNTLSNAYNHSCLGVDNLSSFPYLVIIHLVYKTKKCSCSG